MLDSKINTALNEYIDSVIRNLPNMREEYSVGIEGAREAGVSEDSDLRNYIVQDIAHDLRHESVMIFARHSHSRFPTDKEIEDMGRVVEERIGEIRSVVVALPWL